MCVALANLCLEQVPIYDLHKGTRLLALIHTHINTHLQSQYCAKYHVNSGNSEVDEAWSFLSRKSESGNGETRKKVIIQCGMVGGWHRMGVSEQLGEIALSAYDVQLGEILRVQILSRI